MRFLVTVGHGGRVGNSTRPFRQGEIVEPSTPEELAAFKADKYLQPLDSPACEEKQDQEPPPAQGGEKTTPPKAEKRKSSDR
jgi:hypothetical protein